MTATTGGGAVVCGRPALEGPWTSAAAEMAASAKRRDCMRVAYQGKMAFHRPRCLSLAVAVVALASISGGCGGQRREGTWPLPNGDLAGTRAVSGSAIAAASVVRLDVRWRFTFTSEPSFAGSFASTPVADHDTVFVQDLRSNVFALDRSTGAVRWEHRFRARNDGPNGLAVDGDRSLVVAVPPATAAWTTERFGRLMAECADRVGHELRSAPDPAVAALGGAGRVRQQARREVAGWWARSRTGGGGGSGCRTTIGTRGGPRACR